MKETILPCPNRDKIKAYCSCPKTDCERHGLCCECITNHKNKVDSAYEKRFPHCLRELYKEATGTGK
jgi:hypothetical protein